MIQFGSGGPETWRFSVSKSPSELDFESGNGLLFDSRESQRDGSFLFTGLQPGRYLLTASHESQGMLIETERRLHHTGKLDARLVLGVHRLVVTANGSLGRRAVYCSQWDGEQEAAFGDRRQRPLSPISLSPTVFVVEPGRRYRVGLGDGRNQFVIRTPKATPSPWIVGGGEMTVTIESDNYITHVELDLARPPGALTLKIEDAQASDSYHLRVSSMPTGLDVCSGYLARESLPLQIALAPGRYRVEVQRVAFGLGAYVAGSFDNRGANTAPTESEFQVDSNWGEVEVSEFGGSRLTVQLQVGGQLQVALPTNALPQLDNSYAGGGLRATFPSSTNFAGWPGLPNDSRGPGWTREQDEFELENSRGERTRGLRFAPAAFNAGGGAPPERNWRKLDGNLAPGQYLLRWRNQDGEILEERIEIKPGKVTSVVFE